MDTFRALWYRPMILFWAVILVLLWLVPRQGPDHPVYGLLVVSWTFFLGPALGDSVMRLPPRWFRVPEGERVLHRMLGVGIFGRLLERSGYNRAFVHPGWESRGYKAGTRGGLYFRALAAQGGSGAHGACFAIHSMLAVLAFCTRHPWGAWGLVLPGVLVHLYPVLLQRLIMLRLQPMLDKLAASRTRERQNGLG
jgi:hypothetical protein